MPAPRGVPRLTRIRSALTALAVAAPLLAVVALSEEAAATPPAGPGTIVYLKGFDVYVAQPDGSGERRLTTDGTAALPYTSPSGADNGLVAVARGPEIIRMDQWGTVLNKIDPPDLTDTAGQTIGGTISQVAFSPDGSKIAYTYEHHSCSGPPWPDCKLRQTTGITAADQLTPPTQYGTEFGDNVAWVTNTRLIMNGVGFDSIRFYDIGVKSLFWFHDGQASSDYEPLFDPVLTRDGTLFAAVRSEGPAAHIAIYAATGNTLSGPPPTWPTGRCMTSTDAALASPTFAPDGSALAWEETSGIWIWQGLDTCSAQLEEAIPGGRTPSWTAAPLQTTRPVYPPSPGDPAPALSFDLRKKPQVKAPGAVKVGRKLTATAGAFSPKPAKVRYRWLRDGKPISRATKARYQVKKADRRHRLSVRVTALRKGYKSITVTSRAVRVR